MDSTIRTPAAPAPDRTPGERFGSPSVWFAFLGGPVAWAAHLLVVYGIVYLPCGWRLPLLLLATGLFALVAIAAGLVAWGKVKGSPARDTDALKGGRNRFVGIAGLLNSSLFLLIILAQGVPPLVLGTCG